MTTQQRTKHIVFNAVLNGHELRVILNSEANHNYIDKRKAKLFYEYLKERDYPKIVRAVNNSLIEVITHYLKGVPLRIGNYNEEISLKIVNLPKYNVVLSIVWLHDHNPSIN
jgi:hypothetical protein